MKILGIETSCDETAASVIEDGRKILSNIIYSQVDEHKKYGGVVPEIASRHHTENIVQTVEQAVNGIENIDAIAVTYAPGLIGALLVGISFAKGLSMAWDKPLVGVHHIKGHIAANYLTFEELKPPFLSLVVSGGHSHVIEVKDYTSFNVLAKTHDDAAGEAFDKAARSMGFPYPGGIYLDKISSQGNPEKYKLPRPKITGHENDFSFSGLKTAVINLIHNSKQKGEEIDTASLAACFQNTVCEMLSDTLMKMAQLHGYKKIVLAGGVSANSGLRSKLIGECESRGYKVFMPPLSLCTDNAAMIASQGYYEFLAGNLSDMSLNGIASLKV